MTDSTFGSVVRPFLSRSRKKRKTSSTGRAIVTVDSILAIPISLCARIMAVVAMAAASAEPMMMPVYRSGSFRTSAFDPKYLPPAALHEVVIISHRLPHGLVRRELLLDGEEVIDLLDLHLRDDGPERLTCDIGEQAHRFVPHLLERVRDRCEFFSHLADLPRLAVQNLTNHVHDTFLSDGPCLWSLCLSRRSHDAQIAGHSGHAVPRTAACEKHRGWRAGTPRADDDGVVHPES